MVLKTSHPIAVLRSLALVAMVASPLAAQTVKLVNMMPQAWSAEPYQNSEPSLAVHPSDPNVLVASATIGSKTLCPTYRSQLYVSTDQGDTWQTACIVPRFPNGNPMDQTVRFSRDGKTLYVGALQPTGNAYAYSFARPTGLTPAQWITQLATSGATSFAVGRLLDADQPQVETMLTAARGIATGATVRSMSPAPCTQSTAVVSLNDDPVLNPWSTPSAFDVCVGVRPSNGPIPATRVASHQDGTTYALFYRPVVGGTKVDVVLVRNDPGSVGSARFTALKDPGAPGAPVGTSSTECGLNDGLPGRRVVKCAAYPYLGWSPSAEDFGQQRRIWSDLAIVVNPANSSQLYIVYGDWPPAGASRLTLHLMYSSDRGANFVELATISDATNPALAIASDGAVGWLYQRFVGDIAGGRWKTEFGMRTPGVELVTTVVLADALSCVPPRDQHPYLGDYLRLEAVGKSFLGVFSTNNDLVTTVYYPNFFYDRLYDASDHLTDGAGHRVAISIDPFFFKVIR